MLRQCASCGTSFHADAEWKRECFSCWKRQKFWEGERGRELEKLRRDVAFLRTENKRLKARGSDPAWIGRHRRWLIQKLHPDKHGGSEIANEITQILMGER